MKDITGVKDEFLCYLFDIIYIGIFKTSIHFAKFAIK